MALWHCVYFSLTLLLHWSLIDDRLMYCSLCGDSLVKRLIRRSKHSQVPSKSIISTFFRITLKFMFINVRYYFLFEGRGRVTKISIKQLLNQKLIFQSAIYQKMFQNDLFHSFNDVTIHPEYICLGVFMFKIWSSGVILKLLFVINNMYSNTNWMIIHLLYDTVCVLFFIWYFAV